MNKQVSCKFFQEHLNDYLDSEMDIETRQRMNDHATECPECGERLETMTRLLTMCAELDEGLTIPLDAQAAWRKAVREESTHQQAPKRRGHGFTRALGAVAAAAVLLVGGTFAYRMSGVSPIKQPAGLASYKSAPSAVRSYDFNSNEDAARSRAGAMPIVSEADGEMANAGQGAGASQIVVGAPQDAPPVLGDAPDQAETPTQEATRKSVVLKSAERKMETTGFEQSMVSVQNLVDEYQGYFEQSTVEGRPLEAGNAVGRTASMTVRVQEAQLDEFLASLDAVGTVTYKSESAEDISSQYYDVASRLAAYKAQQTRLGELVKSAANLEDMLLLEDKQTQVQQSIDELEGQMRGWDSLANDAPVYITLTEVAAGGQALVPGTTLEARMKTAFEQSVAWMKGFLQDAAVVLTMAAPALVIAIPLIIVICLIIAGVKRRRNKRR
ncbi:MAG: DUF4349 domain-containing protein [Clostridia bacterium]